MAKGLLIAGFDFSGASADEFHDWYDLEHIPERQRVPGFGACERWIGEEQPKSAIATYDLDTVGVLDSAPYKAIAYDNLSVWSKRVTAQCKRLIRFEGTQVSPSTTAAPAGAGALLLNAMNVAPEAEADFNAWYDEEHLPALAKVPGTLAARRYKAREKEGVTHRYVAIYHLTSPDVTRSDAWRKAVDTPWTARVRPSFRNHTRILTTRYVRRPLASAGKDGTASIVGTWALVRAEAKTEDGAPGPIPYAGHGMGRVSLNRDGRMIAVLCDSRREIPGGGVREYNSYCGNYTFDGKRLVTRVDAAVRPAWMGGDQVRDVSFEDGLMVLRPPLQARLPGAPVVQATLWWKRLATE